ncbi:MFS transporter [Marinobacterium sediminicola]|uniref:MFS transporter, UMF1 family n=1 Tax=Marinobacterium sediminicola TaxID=518898 RepID=A0ABY1S352_9GAMM|nr:MFS transporter [Marinobacterium sediminicola]ULG68173.1 MFS transporter [Marinobacterium sediminicola]SMR77699.1 MFS transporter, UMF1 family [Marinobacterium sediminicola]
MIPDNKKSIWGWAFYDWANSAFSTVVMAGFFPLFFKEFYAAGAAATDSTLYLGVINSIASIIVVLLSPVLGAIADQLGRRKGLLLIFASFGSISTAGLYWVEQGFWLQAACLYIAAVIGFSGGNLFYDALLTVVSPEKDLDRVSALGFALGYLGGGLLFSLNVWMTLHPESFGLSDSTSAIRLAFILTALWWIIFTLPLVLYVREPTPRSIHFSRVVKSSFNQLRQTLKKISLLPQTFQFLLAYWLYIDGVDSIVRMALDYGLSIGLDTKDLILALLITQFIGFPAAIQFGRIGNRLGARLGILIALVTYILVTIFSAFMDSAWQFYVLAIVIGLVQGGVQALSRSLYARLVPPGYTAEFFGFYNMMGKFAAVLGPALIGAVAILSESNRVGILSLLVLFIAGGYILLRVDILKGQAQAKAYRITDSSKG